MQELTTLNTPVSGVLEQNLFYVNQILKFAKFLGVFQADPNDANKTVVTAFMAIAVKASVLDEKRGYENMPVLRNLVPAQVLMGQSSFNSGNSISAGLPVYARNEIKTIAGILQRREIGDDWMAGSRLLREREFARRHKICLLAPIPFREHASLCQPRRVPQRNRRRNRPESSSEAGNSGSIAAAPLPT